MKTIHHALTSATPGVRVELQSLHFGTPGAGPKATLQAALHADEIPGLLVAHHLRERLAALEAEGRIAGEVVLVPVANPIGLAQRVLHGTMGRFELAQREAAAANDAELAGDIATDRAQALVGLGLLDDAGAALADARRDAPQSSDAWLLSATLSRRQGKLADAQAQIESAAALAPSDPAVGLEAGVIAALGGRDDAARQSFNSVLSLAPNSPQAATARSYLAQLAEPPAAR